LVDRFARSPQYHPADLFPQLYPHARTEKLDLMQLCESERYDLVYLSHVLEHVPDDRRVLTNLFTALRPGGEAWLLVPQSGERLTVDGSHAMPPRERERRFGQWDHVRLYGDDFIDRVRAAGFEVSLIDPAHFPAEDCAVHGLNTEDRIYRGRKPLS